MSMIRYGRAVAAALIMSGTIAVSLACATPRGRVYVRVGPPAPIVETRVVAPGPGYLWQPGFYRWNGGAYAWVPGRWERAPRPRAVWVPGRWVRERQHGWYFVEGHWR
jgi:YXWGXW repeat-containing protein